MSVIKQKQPRRKYGRFAHFSAGVFAGGVLYFLFIQVVPLPDTAKEPGSSPTNRIKAFAQRVLIPKRVRSLNRRATDSEIQRQAQYQELTEYYNASNILLKQLIQKDHPQLEDPHLDDWTKVTLLRQWAYENVDWGVQSTHINSNPEIRYFSLSTPMLFATFCRDVGGTYCGGTSFALMRLYRLYGFTTYTFGMGNPEMMTHTVTLVQINHKGNEKLTVQDASFNLTYVDAEGEPFDFFQLLRTLKNHNHQLVHIEEKFDCIRDIIYSNKRELGPIREDLIPDKENGKLEEQLPGGKFKAKVCLDLAYFNDTYGPNIGRFLINDGHPPESIYLYLYPVSINDGTGEAPLIQQAKAIVNAPDRQPVIARKPEAGRN